MIRRARRKHPEDAIQIAIVDYLRAVLVPRDYKVAAIPNGGKRGKAEAGIMKATGTLAGMPDLIIIGPLGHCFFIEVKASKGTESEAQIAMKEWMISIGVPCAVVRGIDDVRAAIAHWNLKTREVLS